MPHISVIIVNYNAGAHLSRCIAALAAQTHDDFEILLADNASTDDSLARCALDALSDIPHTILHFDENLGFAEANNRAAANAAGTWLAFLNPDAFPRPDWLQRLQDATMRYPETAMFGSTQLADDDPERVDGAGDMLHALGVPWRGLYRKPVDQLPAQDCEVFAPCAAASLVRADVFRDSGGFDARFFCYCEDIDLAFRLRLWGHRCIQLRHAIVSHVGSAITGKESAFSAFHGARNRHWVFIKNMPGPLCWTLYPFHLLTQLALIVWAIPQGVAGPTARGLWAGVRGSGPVFHARKGIQARRTASIRAIAGALCWSPLPLLRRSATYTFRT